MTAAQWFRRARHALNVGLPDTPRVLRPLVRVLYIFGVLHSPSWVGQ